MTQEKHHECDPLPRLREAVLTSICFDDEPGSERNEVDDIGTDGRLSPDVKPEPLQLAQLRPQFDFLWRETFTKCASIFVCQNSGPILMMRCNESLPLALRDCSISGQPPARPAFGRPPSPQGGGIRKQSADGVPVRHSHSDCLAGKSRICCPALLAKIFAFLSKANHVISCAVSSHSRGVSRSSRTRDGMRWTLMVLLTNST